MRSSLGWLRDVRGSVRAGLSCALAALVLVPVCLWATAPAWWTERGVLVPGATPDDYAAVNQGQVKHIAKQAYEEMKAKGVVDPVAAQASTDPLDPSRILFLAWESPAAGTDDYLAANLGQLKHVAQPFYDRLNTISNTTAYPWSGTADDYALANIGQLKNLFSFSIEAPLEDYYITILSGNHQVGAGGEFLPNALKIRVTDKLGLPVSNVEVVFKAITQGGGLSAELGQTALMQLERPTSLLGEAAVFIKLSGGVADTNLTSAKINQAEIYCLNYVRKGMTSSAGSAVPPTAPTASSPMSGGAPSALPDFWNDLPQISEPPPNLVEGFILKDFYDAEGIPDYSSVVLHWIIQREGVSLVCERREDFGEWVELGDISSGYTNAGLKAGVLYEYRLKGIKDGATVGYSPSLAYDVPILKSVVYQAQALSAGRHDGINIVGREGQMLEDGFKLLAFSFYVHWKNGALHYPTVDHSWPDALPRDYAVNFYATDDVSGLRWAEQVWCASSESESIAEDSSVTFKTMNASRVIGMRVASNEEMWFDVYIGAASYFLIKYRGAIISPYSIPSSGLELRPSESFEILPSYGVTYDVPTLQGSSGWASEEYLGEVGRGWDVPELNIAHTGLQKTGSSQLGRALYSNAEYTPAPTTIITMPASAVNDNGSESRSVIIGDITFSVRNPFPISDAGANIPLSESSGAKFRKIALNGAPLSDEKPQQEEETDQAREETFIDALTLGLRHDTTDTYTAVPAADLFLGVRRSASSEVWNLRRGLLPKERPDRPFGTGWTSNLAANIHFTKMLGSASGDSIQNPDTATVTDENGMSYTFAILYAENTIYNSTTGYQGEETFVPLPSSKHDQSAHLTSLVKEGDNYIFKRKYGTTLTYALSGLKTDLPSDRIDGSSGGEENKWARLESVEDRYGNALDYDYGNSVYTLIPHKITVRRSSGQRETLSIKQDERGLVTDVWDPSGCHVSYVYTAEGDTHQLASVIASDGAPTTYEYEIVSEPDQSPDTVDPHHQPKVHFNLSKITAPQDRSYTFEYLFDHTKQDYSSTGYYTKTGLPRLIHTVTAPNGDSSIYANESTVKLARNATTHRLEFAGTRRTRVTDAEGNQRVYDFTSPMVEEMSNFASVYHKQEKFDAPRMIYYREMEITSYQKAGSTQEELGSQSYTFDPASGMSLTSAVDFSINNPTPSKTTTYEYANEFSNSLFIEAGTGSTLYGRYSDPTSQTNALGKTKVFTYDEDTRIMTSSKDENGTLTTWELANDGTGRRTSETVTDKDGVVLAHTTYHYKDTVGAYLHNAPGLTYDDVSRNFLTKKVVKRNTASTSDPTWVGEMGDLVTVYVPAYVMTDPNDPNSAIVTSRVGKEIVDPANLALITEYTYDLNGNKLTTKDPRGNITHFSYDKRNRLTHVTYQDGHQKQFFYDARGNKTQEIDENGVATFWRYDALNRVVDHVVDMDGSLKAAYAATHALPDTLTLDRTKHIVTTYKYNKLNAKVEVVGPKLTETAPGQFRTTVTKFEYDALQRLKKKTDDYSQTPSTWYFNYVTTYDYDLTKNPGGSVFDSSGWKPTHITDPRGYRTEVTYDALYRPVEESVEYQPNAYAVTNKEYDDVGNLTKVTAPSAHLTGDETARRVTETTYDGLRRPLTVTEALGTPKAVTTKTDYTSTGFAWRTIADYDQANTRLNLETRTEYDAAGRPVKVFTPKVDDALTAATTLVSPMTETRYDAAGNVDHVINPLGQRTDYAYDNRNRRYEEKLPAITDATTGLTSRPIRTTAYDGVGNVIAVQDARGFVTTTEYDNARRPEKVIAPPVTRLDGTTVHPETVTTYDQAGNILTLTDANGHVTTNTYDALGRLKTTLQKPDTNPAHDILIKNTYDQAGNRTEVEDGKNQVTKFEYDGLNRNTKITDPALRATEYTYDAVVKTERIDPENQKTRYDYDVRHRLETVIYDGRPVDNRTYVYDDLGRLKTVTEPNKPGTVATVAYTYDALGRQLTETSNGKTHTYGYDLANNRVTVTYGGTGTVLTSTYDAHNRLETLSELPASAPPASARLTTYSYDLNGNRVLQELPNGEEVDTQFDPLNRPVAITTTKTSGALLLQLLQTYDPAGNLVRLTERHFASTLKPRTVTNTYDNVNRLITEVNVEGAKTIATTYGFDQANNRTSKAVATTTGSGTTVIETIYGYNHLNQLETATEGSKITSFTYDLNGNRETRSVQTEDPGILPVDTYTYDYENRLVGLTKNTPGGTGIYTYVYDYRTRRVERTESGTTTRMVFSGGVSVSEYTGGTPAVASAEYIRGSDWGGGVGGLLYSVRFGEPSFKHYNSRGDVISATNAAGAATWQGTYEAFGIRTQEVGTTLDRQKANTKEEDPTGLLNEGFRYRCLETGVFITRDPLGFVDGPNMYAYVVQNPWSKFDPEGLSSWGWSKWDFIPGVQIVHAAYDLGFSIGDNLEHLRQNVNNSMANADAMSRASPDEAIGILQRNNQNVRDSLAPAAELALSVPGTSATGPASLPSEVGLASTFVRGAEVKTATAVVLNAEAKASSGGTAVVETAQTALVTQNAQQGRAFQQVVASQAAQTQTGVVQELTLKTASGVKTRIDIAGRDAASGTTVLTEAKSSATAPLTPAQKAAFPEIEQTGATVVGKGKPGFPGGTQIPPTKVKVVRPADTQTTGS